LDPYGEAIKFNPRYSFSYSPKGAAYGLSGDDEKAIQINPDYPENYNQRGVGFHTIGRLDNAIGTFDQPIDLNAEFAAAYNN